MRARGRFIVERGDYAKIAEQMGYSRDYVAKVARGKARNVKIELVLAEYAKKKAQHERYISTLKSRLKKIHEQK